MYFASRHELVSRQRAALNPVLCSSGDNYRFYADTNFSYFIVSAYLHVRIV